ncbi:hypothetical protein [Pectobacterium versatile]|uniref:hypothetical protein n=1 Tax=Pectobacterium versatile TaxID=2488639 RepID=UPI002B252768|nr:hypothetical protein [Pectobacterium versatile]
MLNKGIEDSVASTFISNLQLWCMDQNIDDLFFDMNGSDRNVNADTMFSVCDRFFLVEMKSKESNIKDEAAKPAVCVLCTGLKDHWKLRTLHRACHYIMWGQINQPHLRLETYYSVYENAVCRPEVLPDCPSVTKAPKQIILPGLHLTSLIAKGEGGLTGNYFFPYLAWLLGNRSGPFVPFTPKNNIPIALVGNSFNRRVIGKLFESYDELNNWGEEALLNKLKGDRSASHP